MSVKQCLRSVNRDKFPMQITQKSKHSNVGFTKMAGNPRRERFPTETPLERELRLEIQSEQLRGRREQETRVEQREYRFALRRRSR